MTLPFRSFSLVLLSAAALACGSSSSGDDTGASGGSATAAPRHFGMSAWSPSGVGVSESDACTAYKAAFESSLTKHACTYTGPAIQCPSFLWSAEYDEQTSKQFYCGQFDQGVLDGCTSFLATLQCDEFATASCDLLVLPSTATSDMSCENATGAGGAAGSGGSSAGGSSSGGSGGGETGGTSAGGSAGAGGETGGTSAGGTGGASGSAGAGGLATLRKNDAPPGRVSGGA